MEKLLLLTISVVFIICSLQVQSMMSNKAECRQWRRFMINYNKSYSGKAEYKHRKQIFTDNLKLIEKLNRKYHRERLNFSCAVNAYADLTQKEFREKFAGIKFQATPSISPKISKVDTITKANKPKISRSALKLAESVDWRPIAVTPVKNQGKCGSCWSFASVASLEGQLLKKFKLNVPLSMQNLIDCVKTEDTDGCNGGIMPDAFQWVKQNGIMKEADYPYEGNDTNVCRFNKKKSIGTCNGYVLLPSESEEKLQEAVANIGPVAVGIDAANPSLQFYSKGIYYDAKCSSQGINHAVTVVGYGKAGLDQDYWIIKNSWGVRWGEKGFFRLARNRNNHCGVSTYACYPVV